MDKRFEKPVRIPKVKRYLNILFSEECLAARRQVVRVELKQGEQVCIYSAQPIEVGKHRPHVHRDHYSGTNFGDSIGWVWM